MCETVLCTVKSATKPPNTKTWACMYLQGEPSTPPSGEPSGDTDEATDPDEFSQGSSNHSPEPMELFKTHDDDKSISVHDTGELPFCPYPRYKSPCKEYKCPAHPHLHSTLDQSYQNHLTTSLLDTYFFA